MLFKKVFVALIFLFSFNLLSQQKLDIYPLKDVKEGSVAKGYTVLKGEDIFEFEAEVIGVQKIGSSGTDYIICKLRGKPFDECGVVAAMSGSPLYLDGKFLGAIAIGWFFAKEPLCAATPAEKMVELYDGAYSGGASFGAKTSITLDDFLSNLNRFDLSHKEFLKKLEEKSVSISQGSEQIFKEDAEIKPGGMIGVQLISGDLNLTAFGTVSAVKGDKFLAFGHSFLEFGEVDFPVVKAKVSTIMPSFAFSFKMSSSQEEIGRMVLDSPYGVVCEKGKKSDTIPIEIIYTNSKSVTATKRVNIVRHTELSKMLFFLSVSQICENLETNKISSHAVLESTEFSFSNGTKLNLTKQLFGGEEPLLQLSSFLSDIFSLLVSNPYEKPKIKKISLKIRTENGKSEGNLIQIKSLKNRFFKGENIEIEGVFQPYEKSPSLFKFSIPTENMPLEKVKIAVGDSISIYKRLIKSLEFIPNSFESILSVVRMIPEGGKIYASAFEEEESVLIGNSRIYNLPITLKNIASSSIHNSNPKSSEKVIIKPFSVSESGFFTSELEITVDITERKEQ